MISIYSNYLIIKKYSESVEKVSIPEAEIDVDTIADYEQLLSKYT